MLCKFLIKLKSKSGSINTKIPDGAFSAMIDGIVDNSNTDLEDVYQFEDMLQIMYPYNHNVKAKIHQQLQLLRDNDIIEFLGNGKYKTV